MKDQKKKVLKIAKSMPKEKTVNISGRDDKDEFYLKNIKK